MGFWRKLLGVTRIFSPKVDKLATAAEEAHDQTEDVKEAADQAREFVEKLKGLPDCDPYEWSPGARPQFDGEFLLFRNGKPLREYDGDPFQATCRAGESLPPVPKAGDRWRRVL